uniref:Uncharacterized protein n=1 Tax=Oryza glumipatula TaxID=40148 RepID=A0A0D9ZK07_9ORYZ
MESPPNLQMTPVGGWIWQALPLLCGSCRLSSPVHGFSGPGPPPPRGSCHLFRPLHRAWIRRCALTARRRNNDYGNGGRESLLDFLAAATGGAMGDMETGNGIGGMSHA